MNRIESMLKIKTLYIKSKIKIYEQRSIDFETSIKILHNRNELCLLQQYNYMMILIVILNQKFQINKKSSFQLRVQIFLIPWALFVLLDRQKFYKTTSLINIIKHQKEIQSSVLISVKTKNQKLKKIHTKKMTILTLKIVLLRFLIEYDNQIIEV